MNKYTTGGIVKTRAFVKEGVERGVHVNPRTGHARWHAYHDGQLFVIKGRVSGGWFHANDWRDQSWIDRYYTPERVTKGPVRSLTDAKQRAREHALRT